MKYNMIFYKTYCLKKKGKNKTYIFFYFILNIKYNNIYAI